jgi:energy-coupling factor transporter ATP-binding protein EcfA2
MRELLMPYLNYTRKENLLEAMSIEINNLTISGIIQNAINLSLNGKSILLYGKNGSRKNSITTLLNGYIKTVCWV